MSCGRSLKKEKNLKEGEDGGDLWVYTCMRRRSYFMCGFSIGRWTQKTCREMITRVKDCIEEGKPTFYSDGNDDYLYVLPEFFKELDYGQIVKKRINGKLVDKEKRAQVGNPSEKRIETYNVENLNSILRNHLSRLVRKGKGFTKIDKRLHDALALFQFTWNFIHPLKSKKTPATIERLAEQAWTWKSSSHTSIPYIKGHWAIFI